MQLDVVRALGTLRDTSALVELTRDGDTIVAVGAVRALMSVAPTHTALIDALDDPRSDVVDAAIMGVVPILARDSVIATPRTAGGLAALDSARVLAHAIIASRLVGKCFSVQWGTFEPSMRFGADSVFSIPPRTIAFLADPSSFPFGRGYAATIAPANGAAYSVHGPGLWSWDEGADSLRAAWTTGFSGVALNAGWSGAELRGTLSTFWDFPRPQQRAAVTLSPVACTSVRTAMDR